MIRRLTAIDDCRRVARLEQEIWGYASPDDVLPTLLVASVKRGGILLGAFDANGEMQGFVYSMPGWKGPVPIQWSHTLGVVADARGRGIGRELKLAQRDASLAMGIELVEWTYDPLQAVNAHFNFAGLGVVVEEYEEDVYGESTSPLHHGTPTDRFMVEWHLRSPKVERRVFCRERRGFERDTTVKPPLVNPPRNPDRAIEPGPADLDIAAKQLLVEIPNAFTDIQRQTPELAVAWRMGTREIFQTYFSRGYRAVDFFLTPGAQRGQYLLVRKGTE